MHRTLQTHGQCELDSSFTETRCRLTSHSGTIVVPQYLSVRGVSETRTDRRERNEPHIEQPVRS